MFTNGRRMSAQIALSIGAYAILVRPRLLRWGATDEEVRGPYPGGDLVPRAKRNATMAVTIGAPPSRVWPWLLQMGCDRAGWYSWDRLDNGGVPSAQHISPEWQDVAVGECLSSTRSGRSWFEVAVVQRERFLALRARLDLRGHPFDTAGPRPRFYSDSLSAFLLEELPRERTRLVVSGYACSRPRLLTAIGEFLFWEPAHWIMQTRQFANLKRRVERDAHRSATPRVDPPGSLVSPSEPPERQAARC
jgi:proline iminopeptidase